MVKGRKRFTRAYIHSLRGKYKHLPLLKILMEERAKDLEREEAKIAYWARKRKRPR